MQPEPDLPEHHSSGSRNLRIILVLPMFAFWKVLAFMISSREVINHLWEFGWWDVLSSPEFRLTIY